MNNKLREIIAHKKYEIQDIDSRIPEWARNPIFGKEDLSFYQFIKESYKDQIAIIAESKRKSPSAGEIVKDYNIEEQVTKYENANATCLSVLTDEKYFGGSLEDLRKSKTITNIPVLRKDFILDSRQVLESKLNGADCILLIVAALTESDVRKFSALAPNLELEVIFEVHTEDEINIALNANAKMIGINNRDLNTFECDLATTEKLAPLIKNEDCLIISESAIKTVDDVKRVRDAGVDAILVGETLMKSKDVIATISQFSLPRK